MLHSLADVFGAVLEFIETPVAWLAEQAHWLGSQQGVWALVGATVGFAGNSLLQAIQRRRQRRIASMQVAINLRHWMNRVLERVYQTRNWESSDGQGGNAYIDMPELRFESALEQVALLDRKMAMRIFDLIHRKDDTNSATEAVGEYQSDDDAIDAFRGGAAALWLEALDIYGDISRRIGWEKHVFSEDDRAMMRGEVERLRISKESDTTSAQEMRDMFGEANSGPDR
jgi:hypothetical protein